MNKPPLTITRDASLRDRGEVRKGGGGAPQNISELVVVATVTADHNAEFPTKVRQAPLPEVAPHLPRERVGRILEVHPRAIVGSLFVVCLSTAVFFLIPSDAVTAT